MTLLYKARGPHGQRYRCDGCGREASQMDRRASGWLTVFRVDRSGDEPDFCSWGCLSVYAGRAALSPAAGDGGGGR